MALVIQKTYEYLKYLNNECADPRVKDYPLMQDPTKIIGILIVYWFFVKKIGPKFMEYREPFQLDGIIRVYNIFQTLVNGYITYEAFTSGYMWKFNWFCESVEYSSSPFAQRILRFAYTYFLVKLLDLMDTIFFVLRKKDNQVTFLHVYHHISKKFIQVVTKKLNILNFTVVAFFTWAGFKFVAGGHSVFFGHINSLVHTVMYFYYFLTSVSIEYKKSVWWKKYITQLQMVRVYISHVSKPNFLFN